MTLDFVDGVLVTAAIVGIVGALMAWQSRRCTINVNEINNQINAILVRQTLMAERMGVELPPVDKVIEEMGYNLPAICRSRRGIPTSLKAEETPRGGPTQQCDRE
jgi:hypothetical protein